MADRNHDWFEHKKSVLDDIADLETEMERMNQRLHTLENWKISFSAKVFLLSALGATIPTLFLLALEVYKVYRGL